MYQFIVHLNGGHNQRYDFDTIEAAQSFFDSNREAWVASGEVSYLQFITPDSPEIVGEDI